MEPTAVAIPWWVLQVVLVLCFRCSLSLAVPVSNLFSRTVLQEPGPRSSPRNLTLDISMTAHAVSVSDLVVVAFAEFEVLSFPTPSIKLQHSSYNPMCMRPSCLRSIAPPASAPLPPSQPVQQFILEAHGLMLTSLAFFAFFSASFFSFSASFLAFSRNCL